MFTDLRKPLFPKYTVFKKINKIIFCLTIRSKATCSKSQMVANDNAYEFGNYVSSYVDGVSFGPLIIKSLQPGGLTFVNQAITYLVNISNPNLLIMVWRRVYNLK